MACGTVALMDQSTAAVSTLASRTRGYMDGRTLAEVFAWLRPDDLIWNYWVNNYLEGKTPPPLAGEPQQRHAGRPQRAGQRQAPAARSRAG